VTINPNLVGPVSPTPIAVYEPRIWKVRIWTKGGPFEGTGVFFKAPYGVYMNAVQLLARAVARNQISRFSFGPLTKRDFATLDRKALRRFDEAFAPIAERYQIDLSA
jgi:hypothetical protein